MASMEIVSFCRIIPLCNFQYRNHVHSIILISFQIILQNVLQILSMTGRHAQIKDCHFLLMSAQWWGIMQCLQRFYFFSSLFLCCRLGRLTAPKKLRKVIVFFFFFFCCIGVKFFCQMVSILFCTIDTKIFF